MTMLIDADLKLTVVAPYFNEEEVIVAYLTDLKQNLENLELGYEVILVDDGSTDGTLKKIEDFNWKNLKVVLLNGNRGHQFALKVGLFNAKGRYVITMDSDMQHPASLIKEMIYEADSSDIGIVQGVRPSRSKDSFLKRNSARFYYGLIKLLTGVNVVSDAADFRLIKSEVVDGILNHHSNILRLIIPSLGVKIKYFDFEAENRFAGHSKYSFPKMLKLAFSSAIDFSARPLKLLSISGLIISMLSFLSAVLLIGNYIFGNSVPGWTSISVLIVFFSGIQLASLSTIGIYLSKINESRRELSSKFIVREFKNYD